MIKVQQQLADVQSKMQQNLSLAMDREQALNELETKSADLIQQSKYFQAKSQEVKRQAKLRQIKCWLGIVLGLGLVGFLVYLLFFSN
jgi:hypothetical protein